MVVNEKKALVPIVHVKYRALKLKYGERVEHLNVMTLGSVKTLADGTPGRLKVRIVVTDVAKAAPSLARLTPVRLTTLPFASCSRRPSVASGSDATCST